MIRVITARTPEGIPTEWADYPDREIGEVSAMLALRFDAELASLKVAGVSLGVKRWTEVAYRARKFNADALEWLAQQADSESAADDRDAALEAWMVEHPDYWLAQQVGIWAAINLGGGRMTLADVLNLADRQPVRNPNTYSSGEHYDILGRRLTLGVNYKF